MDGKYWVGVEKTTLVYRLDQSGNQVLQRQFNIGYHLLLLARLLSMMEKNLVSGMEKLLLHP